MNIKRYIFEPNGEEVIKVTEGRVTGYISASIPLEALQIWHKRLGAKLKRAERLKFRVRSGKRPRLKQRRVQTRRRRPEKRYRGRLRYWSDAPRR
jgi:cytidylate kinase